MKFRDLSIRWKLIVIPVCVVIFPTVILGALSYSAFRNELINSVQKELVVASQNWQAITNSYVQQEDRVLKRELVLIEQRLETSAFTAKRIFESGVIHATRESIYSDLSQIKIGRAGYVFVLDAQGTYVLSKDHVRDGEKLWETTDIAGTPIIQNLIKEGRSLDVEDSYTITYKWKEVGDDKLRDQLVVIVYSKKYDLIFGATMYYSDFQSVELKAILQDELRARMSAQKIKESGYVWAIDSQGGYLVSKDKLRDGEKIFDFKDANDVYVIREIIQEAEKLNFGETYSRRYAWENVGEDVPRNQLAVFTYVPEWDWIIGATAYDDDYLKGLSTIRLYIFSICAFMVVVGSIVAYLFTLFLIKPIKKLEGIARKTIAGDLMVKVSPDLLAQGAEIGSLSRSFDSMITKLFENINRLDSSNKEVVESSKVLETKNNELEQLNKLMVDRELKMIQLKKEVSELKARLPVAQILKE